MVFQSYAIWPHMTVAENVAFPLTVAKNRRYSRTEIEEAVKRALAVVDLDGFQQRPATRLVRRPAAAGGAGARHRARAAAAPARRAAVQSRRPVARRDARRAQAAAEQDRHHHRLCHARPVRGAGAVGPDRGHRQGPHHADRLAARHLFPAGQPVRRPLCRRDQPAAGPLDRLRQRPRPGRSVKRAANPMHHAAEHRRSGVGVGLDPARKHPADTAGLRRHAGRPETVCRVASAASPSSAMPAGSTS